MKFSKEKIIAITGTALAILGVFLPFFTATAKGIKKISFSYFEILNGRGNALYIVIAMVIALAIFLFVKNKKVTYSLPSFMCGFVIGLTMIDGLVGVEGRMKKQLVGYGTVNLNIGFYFIIVGAVLFLLAIVLDSRKNKLSKVSNTNTGVVNTNNTPVQPLVPEQNLYTAPIPEMINQPSVQETVEPVQPIVEESVQPITPVQGPTLVESEPVYTSEPVDVITPVEPVQPVLEEQVREPEVEIIEPVADAVEPVETVQPIESVVEEPVQPTEPVIEESSSVETPQVESVIEEPIPEIEPQNKFFTNPVTEESTEEPKNDDNLSNDIFNF